MKKNSFTLIEVLVFVSILLVFFITAMIITTYNLKSLKTSQYKILASYYTGQAIDWLTVEKWIDWNNFLNKSNSIYCLNQLSWDFPGNCSNYSLGTPAIFKRELTLTTNNNQVEAQIKISWNDVVGEETLIVKKNFNQLE